MLRTMALAGLGAGALPEQVLAQNVVKPGGLAAAATKYLEALSRPDGGYAWEDQEQSHLTSTFAVIGCFRVLRQTPPNKAAVAEFVRTHHPSRLKKLEQERRVFELQQVQSLVWLGEDASELAEKISSWREPLAYLKQYEQHGYPIFQSEMGAILCRSLLKLSLDDLSPAFTAYLNARRRNNGSFNNAPVTDGGDGHVMNTWWGLQALRVFGRADEKKEETAAWLRSCQLPNGGFTYQPKAEFGGGNDVAYTWAAVRALKQCGAAPANRDGCLGYLHSLANTDGGFGAKPGWLSNPVATYYALEALEALGALDLVPARKSQSVNRHPALHGNLRVFSVQIEAHGHGSPAEAVDLAHALRIHLWGAKNAKPEWLARCQALADQQKVPVRFFVSDEEYSTWVNVPGLGTYSHTSDIIAPSGSNFGPSLSNQGVVSWPEFHERRWAPLQKAGGRLIWQFGENEELVRLYLDDSVQRGGYAAISTFHFGNPDFTNTEPFLNHYRGRIPFIALQDSHGSEPWWFADMTTGFRTVFLATEPTWDAWLQALERNWVVAVRHDAVSGFKTWMHGGSSEVLDFVRQHERNWRWWDNAEIQRPLVSIVAVKPQDEFETARPGVGVMLRVRCAWENTTQGLPKNPLTELVKLTVDRNEVTPVLVAKKAARGAAYQDHYHQFHLVNPASGKHTATAHIRVIESKVESSRTVGFVV